MALNKFTQIGNSGFGTDTSINTTGIVTAASFSGDGSALTGVVGSGSGVVVQEEGTNVGTAQTINFVGTGVTATISGAVARIEITSGSGGGGGGGLSDVVSDTTPQLGGNLDLNSNNITGTGDINITGDATFSGDLDVDGHVNLDNVSIAGVSTFTGEVNFNQHINLGDNDEIRLGDDDDFYIRNRPSGSFNYGEIVHSGTHIRIASDKIILDASNGNNMLDGTQGGAVNVYYSGSKKFETTNTGAIVTGTLVATATTATNVTVADESSDTSCFLLYSTEATGNVSPKTGSNLTFNSSSGTLSAGSFVGDGSGLTGITASGSGVVVRDDGSLVGTAGTIDFGANVSVSPISAGVVTVTADAGTIAGINTSATTELTHLTATGVITATSFNGNGASVTNVNAVSIGGTPLTDLQKKNADTDLVMFNQILHFGPANTKSRIRWSGTTSLWDLIDGDLKIRDNTTDRFTFERTTGNFSASNVNVSGIITASSFSGDGSALTNLPASGISTASTNVQATWSVGGDTSGYTFTGPGQDGAEQNPDIYLVRGQRYRFINTTGSGHPFEIRVSDGGSAYTDGITGSTSGTQDFNVQHDAPVRLYYQCTIHSGMIGNIYIVGGSDWRMTDVTTAQTPEIFTNLNVGINTDNPTTRLEIGDSDYSTNLQGSVGFQLTAKTDSTGVAFNMVQKEGYKWIQYHGSTSSWIGKGNYGFAWNDGVADATGLSVGITTEGYIVGNRNVVQVIDATTATRFNGSGTNTLITSSVIKCNSNRSRFMIHVHCPVNSSDDSDAGNGNENPYFAGYVQRNLNGGGWTDCGGKGSSSQGGHNAHIELSPNRTGDNGTTDYWSGNRYRMEHKYVHFFDDELSPGDNNTIQFRLRVVNHGGGDWIQIGEPHGFGTDDNYPCQRWGMMIYELGPDTRFTVVNKVT
jgi:hypothetical protein